MNPIIIDVRESDEYAAEHIEHSIHIPLSNFSRQAPSFLRTLSGRPVVLMCRSGKRASLAAAEAATFDCDVKPEVFTGGIQEWVKQGKAVVRLQRTRLPLMRQVQIGAGSLAFVGAMLAHFVHPSFIFVSAFVGAGLMVAGATGFCGMAKLLGRMPWNRQMGEGAGQTCAR